MASAYTSLVYRFTFILGAGKGNRKVIMATLPVFQRVDGVGTAFEVEVEVEEEVRGWRRYPST